MSEEMCCTIFKMDLHLYSYRMTFVTELVGGDPVQKFLFYE
jgi:hypothetical protein